MQLCRQSCLYFEYLLGVVVGVLNFQMLPGSFCGKCHHSNDVTALVLKETKESGELM